MASKWLIAAGVSVLLGTGHASADDALQFSGTLGGGDIYYDAPDKHIGDWNANGSVLVSIGNPGFNLQADFDNDNLSASAHGGDFWSYGADAYWRDYAGAIGLNADAHAISNSIENGKGADFTNYGGFGQWYAAPEATLELKGGWMSGHYDGPYAGGGIVGYPLDSLALDLTADYAKADSQNTQLKDVGIFVEWLPLPEIPVSVGFGYTRTEIDGAVVPPFGDRDLDVWSVAIKAYFGGGGAGNTLRDYQRNGAVSYDSAPTALVQFGY